MILDENHVMAIIRVCSNEYVIKNNYIFLKDEMRAMTVGTAKDIVRTKLHEMVDELCAKLDEVPA